MKYAFHVCIALSDGMHVSKLNQQHPFVFNKQIQFMDSGELSGLMWKERQGKHMRWIGVTEEEDAKGGGGARSYTVTILDEEPEFDALNLSSMAFVKSCGTWADAVLQFCVLLSSEDTLNLATRTNICPANANKGALPLRSKSSVFSGKPPFLALPHFPCFELLTLAFHRVRARVFPLVPLTMGAQEVCQDKVQTAGLWAVSAANFEGQ